MTTISCATGASASKTWRAMWNGSRRVGGAEDRPGEEAIVHVARLMGTVRPMGIVYGNGIGDQQADGH